MRSCRFPMSVFQRGSAQGRVCRATRRLVSYPLSSIFRLFFAYVFVPNSEIRLDVVRQQIDALLRIEVNHLHAQGTKPFDPTLKVSALTHHQRTKSKLPHQPAAIPARSEGRDHN